MRGDLSEQADPSMLPLQWPWTLHDQPDRQLDSFARLCACAVCTDALCAQAEVRPHTPICLKTEHDRVLVDLALFCEALRGKGLDSLLYVTGDRIREYFVPTDMRPRPRDLRWWSLTCHEDDEVLGRPQQRRRRPRRESALARAVRRSAVAAPEASAASTGPAPRRIVPLRDAVALERVRYRSVIAPLGEWALASGRQVDPDLVALLLAAMDYGSSVDDPVRLHRRAIHPLLWADVFNWLTLREAAYPEHVPDTMWAYIDFLADTGRLHPASDPVDVLREPLMCAFGLDRDGRPASANRHRSAECRCYVEHEGPTHGEVRRSNGGTS